MKEHIACSIKKSFLRYPPFLIFFVTNKCNLGCGHCFYAQQLQADKDDLPLEAIGAFSRTLGTLLEVDISGGEPFLREDFFEIYRLFVDNNHPSIFSIPTNGTLTQKISSDVKKMLDYGGVKHLTIILAIDGPPEVHDRIRGRATYDHVFNTYNELATLKKRSPALHVRANTVISNQNAGCLQELHVALLATMPDLDTHDLEILRGKPRDCAFSAPAPDRLQALRPTCARIFKHYAAKHSFFQARIEYNIRMKLFDAYVKLLSAHAPLWPCWAGRLHCVIDHNGDVAFCELLPAIGNIRDGSFSELWQSDTAREMRAAIRKSRCSCVHSCFQMVNLTFNQRNWPSLLL